MAEMSSTPKRRNRIEIQFSADEFSRLQELTARAASKSPGAYVKQMALDGVQRSRVRNVFAQNWVPQYVLHIQQLAISLDAIASHCDQQGPEREQTIDALRSIRAELAAHRDYFFQRGAPETEEDAS
ncbi:Uncharacterised protein [Burkholderia pseudomallei]|uniref:hypothetical protein n=1 Tax=Burkholderia TaxID=32008 RepID=UPI0005E2AB3A|nr:MULTISPECIES: hypothetical protein [Burkholderia]CFK64691.1 Uncharacterised protein [Burkholderia pseudomallei]CPF87474.1 Uncharacterised protein [Burkholderia pseudomallei]CPG42129.1 Uncharacterised protein [Burkholderia pseudomallei]